MGGSKKVVVGYQYHLGIHFALCHGPVDELQEILVDSRSAWSGSITSTRDITIAADQLFGGTKREGGVSGTVGVRFGEANQSKDAYLVSQLGPVIPAFRGVLSIILKRCYIGTNPYLKPWSFRVKRIPDKGWYASKADIGGNANPAHIIRECLTNGDWGMGYPAASIDDSNFRSVADVLYAEGFGLSFVWNRQAPIHRFIQTVVDHIGAVFRFNPSTGLFEIKLIRDDYTPASLPLLDEGNVIALDKYQRSAWGETVNEIVLKYQNADSRDVSITVQDIGNIQMQGAVVSETVERPGIRYDALAQRVALRELRARSTPTSRVRVIANRQAWGLLPGDAFRLSWPKLGLTEVVYRLMNVDFGELDKGRIVIDAAEDIFGLPAGSYTRQEPVGWTTPNRPPVPAPHRKLYEATYWDLVREIGENDAQAQPADSGFLIAAAVAPSGDALQFTLKDRVSTAAFEEAATGHFCPTCTLGADVGQAISSVLTITNAEDLDGSVVGEYALLGDELVEVTALDLNTGMLTVNRGILDTVPKPHAAGARIFFCYDLNGYDPTERLQGETVDVKLLPVTGLGELDEAPAPIDSLTIAARHARPYPPGNVKLNGAAYPSAITGQLTISWSHRDRLQQTAGFIRQDAGNIGPEPGTTYTLRLYDQNGALARTVTGLTGTSYTWMTEDSDSGLPAGTLNTSVRVELEAVRTGLVSWQTHDIQVAR